MPNQATKTAKPVMTASAAPTKSVNTVNPAPNKKVNMTVNTTAASPAPNFGETFTIWTIQVGAFSRQVSAQDAATKAFGQLAQLVNDAEVSVIGGGKALYRARIVGLTEASAQEACRLLRQKGTDCMAIGPIAGHSLAAAPN